MSKGLNSCLTLGLALGFGIAANARPRLRAGGTLEPQITLRVFDYAGLPVNWLGRALDHTSYVFSKVGVRVTRVLCEVRGSSSSPEACRQSPDPASFQLRILSSPAGPLPGTDGETLGYAAGQVLTVYAARVEEVAALSDLDPDILLGYVVAHELGHALLGSNSHSPAGLMSAQWAGPGLRLIRHNALGFLPAQSERLRVEARLRQGEIGR